MEDKLNEILAELAKGKRNIVLRLPNFDKDINCKIMEVDFRNPAWKPIKVQILDKLTITEDEYVEEGIFGGGEGDTHGVLKKVTKPYRNDWVKLEWIKEIK